MGAKHESIDLQNYFGTIDPDITYREMWHIGIKDQVILNYVYQFIKKGITKTHAKLKNPLAPPKGVYAP